MHLIPSEIKALIHLLEDTDAYVYSMVSNKLLSYGKSIIPTLQQQAAYSFCNLTNERLEEIIHKINYQTLKNDLAEWSGQGYNDLLFGTLLANSYLCPTIETHQIFKDIEKFKKDIWLELNDFLTPLEKANIIHKILYGYHKMEGFEVDYNNVNHFLLSYVLQHKQGNTVSLAIVYQILCDLLDINAGIINIPNQMIIAFYETDFYANNNTHNHSQHILFYVDATTGTPYTISDIKQYLKLNKLKFSEEYFKPISHKQIVKILLQQIAKCFYKPTETQKQKEVSLLCSMVK